MQSDEWMRLFGVCWYSEEYHKRALDEVKAKLDEARLLAEQLKADNIGLCESLGRCKPS